MERKGKERRSRREKKTKSSETNKPEKRMRLCVLAIDPSSPGAEICCIPVHPSIHPTSTLRRTAAHT